MTTIAVVSVHCGHYVVGFAIFACNVPSELKKVIASDYVHCLALAILSMHVWMLQL